MTSPTQGEHAQTEALRPKFGDLLRNTMASESNPRRDAYFIREVHRSGGGVNPGRWFEMTDGKGETWLSNPQNMVPAATAQPAAPQGVAEVNWWEANGDKYDASISPMQPAQGVAYAELPEPDVRRLAIESGLIRKADAMRPTTWGRILRFAQEIHALRASHGQAPASRITVEQVEDAIGLQSTAWDTIGAEKIVEAVLRLANAKAPAAGAVAGPVETIKFSDGSTADPVEKARRYLNAMADHRINSQYFFDDGWPKKESAIDAMATLAVLEQLAAAPTPAAQADSQPAAVLEGDRYLDAWKCERCHGKGWHWQSESVNHGKEIGVENVDLKTHCDACEGCGWCGPDADHAARAPADSVLEDAARLDFLIEQRAYVVSAPDACPGYWLHFVHKETGKCWVQCDEHPTPRAAIDAARKQGAKHD